MCWPYIVSDNMLNLQWWDTAIHREHILVYSDGCSVRHGLSAPKKNTVSFEIQKVRICKVVFGKPWDIGRLFLFVRCPALETCVIETCVRTESLTARKCFHHPVSWTKAHINHLPFIIMCVLSPILNSDLMCLNFDVAAAWLYTAAVNGQRK